MIRLLLVGNNYPGLDHRVIYGETSDQCVVTYALPGKPQGVSDDRYVQFKFGEGFKLRYLYYFTVLFVYLLKNKSNYDLVHFLSTNLILIGPLLAKIAGIPSMITIGGFGRYSPRSKRNTGFLSSLYLRLLIKTIKTSRITLFQNTEDLSWLVNKYPGLSEKCYYIGSAAAFPAVFEKNFDTEKLNILLVSRIIPEKGIDDFLKVAQALSGQNFTFTLVGPISGTHKELANTISRFHDTGLIDYKGELNPENTYKQYKSSHVFLFPSSYGEGIARVLLEAGFTLTCPIAYNMPSNRDLITNGRGFLVDVGDISRVTEVLRQLLLDRNLLMTNAAAYQAFVINNYSLDAFTQRMDAILVKLIK